MEGSKAMDWVWKVFSAIALPMILGLFGWVWTMQQTVTNLQNDLGDLQEAVADLKSSDLEDIKDDIEDLEDDVESSEVVAQGKALVGLEKDIESMKMTLGRIETRIETVVSSCCS